MVPYALALREGGHEVRFATAPSFCAAVERMGFPAIGAGHDFTWERVTDTFPEMAGAMAHGPSHVGELSQRIAWEHWTPRMADDLLELIAEWRLDLIVHEAAEYGGMLAGRVTGEDSGTFSDDARTTEVSAGDGPRVISADSQSGAISFKISAWMRASGFVVPARSLARS